MGLKGDVAVQEDTWYSLGPCDLVAGDLIRGWLARNVLEINGGPENEKWAQDRNISCQWASSHSPGALAVQPTRAHWVNSNRLDNCVGFPRFTGLQFRSASTSLAPISHA